jgi:hypothetical protein
MTSGATGADSAAIAACSASSACNSEAVGDRRDDLPDAALDLGAPLLP